MVTMLEQQFRIKYSEIMENFQCIEYDLKRIYSAMSADDFDENMDMLEFSNMGRTLRDLEEMDNSDGNPYLSEADYDTLDAIRELLAPAKETDKGETLRTVLFDVSVL